MDLLVRLLEGALVVWFVQMFTAIFTVREPYNKALNALAFVLAVVWVVTGQLLVLK